jgi:hypothetical protein
VLDKGITIAFALRLAAKHHRDAESVFITWIVHSSVGIRTLLLGMRTNKVTHLTPKKGDEASHLVKLFR